MSKFHATPKPANRRAFRPVVTGHGKNCHTCTPRVAAKVGAITYSGYVRPSHPNDVFVYKTSKGAEKEARKFTLV